MKPFKKSWPSGFSIIEVLVSVSIFAIALFLFMRGQHAAINSVSSLHKGEDLENLLEERLSLISSSIRTTGTANFLRLYATVSQNLAVYNPILDHDPTLNFPIAFQILNPETLTLNASLVTIQYKIQLQKGLFNTATTQFIQNPFIIGTDTLNEVTLIQIQANGLSQLTNSNAAPIPAARTVTIGF